MNRLRHAVESYYNGEGEADKVIIYFPKRAPTGDGVQETRWMDAALRNGAEADTSVALLFPATAQAPRPQPSAQVNARIAPAGCRIWYEFDKNFHLISAFAGGDEFRSAHNKFYQTGKDAHTLSTEEQVAFQKVRCLVGCKSEFVPVGNLVP